MLRQKSDNLRLHESYEQERVCYQNILVMALLLMWKIKPKCILLWGLGDAKWCCEIKVHALYLVPVCTRTYFSFSYTRSRMTGKTFPACVWEFVSYMIIHMHVTVVYHSYFCPATTQPAISRAWNMVHKRPSPFLPYYCYIMVQSLVSLVWIILMLA